MRHRLELRAASARGDLVGIRSRVPELLCAGLFAAYGYVECADVRPYADRAGPSVSAIRPLTASGRPADAMILAREVVGLLAEAAE